MSWRSLAAWLVGLVALFAFGQSDGAVILRLIHRLSLPLSLSLSLSLRSFRDGGYDRSLIAHWCTCWDMMVVHL
jgi:hypothetical protein